MFSMIRKSLLSVAMNSGKQLKKKKRYIYVCVYIHAENTGVKYFKSY